MTVAGHQIADALRSDANAFLEHHLPAGWRGIGALPPVERDEFLARWREVLLTAGYLGLTWPEGYGGRGLSPLEQSAVQEEFVRRGAPLLPLPSDIFGLTLLGPTILHWGTTEQKQYLLPRILDAEDRWAQGFSEPDAGSDLFALRTRARLDGDEWVVDGQKVWQTEGTAANRIFILARTEPEAPKAKGLSMLLLPIEQPGVVVRPIRSMTGEQEFSEVFFDGARTATQAILGPRGAGAKVAMTLLGFERGSANASVYEAYSAELDRLVEVVRERAPDDSVVRGRLGWCLGKLEILKYLTTAAAERATAGEAPGPESSILKLYESEYQARITELAMDVWGVDGLVRSGGRAMYSTAPDPLGTPNSTAAWQHAYLAARAATIYGGSQQIQLNTLGERVLGLPREPRPTDDGQGR